MFGTSRTKEADSLARMAQKVISANVMVSDADLNIVYMNEAVKTLLRDAESDLRRELPNFSVVPKSSTRRSARYPRP